MMWLPFILATFALANTTFGAVIPDRSFGATLSGRSINDNVFKAPIQSSVSYGSRRNHTHLHKTDVDSARAKDIAVVLYMTVGVGSSAIKFNLMIDTGSSNTWVGAEKSYVRTPTSTDTGETFSVTYGSGSVRGTEFIDTVTIAPGLVILQQSIGVANQYSGALNGLDGILGLGPVDLTSGTLSDTSANIPTVVDNLFSQGSISSNAFGLFFQPVVSRHETTGEITFGGVDSSKFTGSLSFAPITSTSPASQFWGVEASITYGHDQTVMSSTAGIVDSGTSLILIASDAFQKFKEFTGATMDVATGLLTLSARQYHNLHPLFFNIGGEQYELTVNAYTWPRHLNTEIGGRHGDIYLTIADIGTESGHGMDFILGVPFFERFYVVFDTANQQVGIATTKYTHATTH